jgi:hypothetical protein
MRPSEGAPDESAGWDLVVVDELSLFTAIYGTPDDQREFSRLLRDLVSLAVGVPLHDSGPSDVVLYSGAATAGYDASQLNPDPAGVGYLLATAASRSG